MPAMHNWFVWAAHADTLLIGTETIGSNVLDGLDCLRTIREGRSIVMLPPAEGNLGWLWEPSGKKSAFVMLAKKRLAVMTTSVNIFDFEPEDERKEKSKRKDRDG